MPTDRVTRSGWGGPGARLIGLSASFLLAHSCAHARSGDFIDQAVAAEPSRPAPPPAASAPAVVSTELPQEVKADSPLTLAGLIDLALRTNPQTRAAWFDARAAAAGVGVRRAPYYPMADLALPLSAQRQASLGRAADGASVGPAVSLSYLVLDLGGRAADLEEARQQLAIANFTHQAALQDLVFRVEQAYYQLLALKALKEATTSNLEEATTVLTSATERQKAGIATVADVLQARTAASGARLTQRTVEGQVQIAQGVLAYSLGLPATTPVQVGQLPAEVPATELSQDVEKLVAQAEALRPELAAAKSQISRAEARVRSAASAGLPSLVVGGNAALQYYPGASSALGESYGAALTLRFPLFTGFRDSYAQAQAQEAVGAAQERAQFTRQQLALQVWTSYQSVQTAAERLAASRDLLQSAQASSEVATGRYQAGAGTLIDLLTAQAALAQARAQEVQSRADYLLSLAALAHDTGTLGLGERDR